MSFPVFLRTLSSGYIYVDSSQDSLINFFSVNNAEPYDKHPKYIHIAMDERIKLCYDDIEAKRIFEDCPHFSHRLHKFIKSSNNYSSKLRVHWKIYKPSIAYIITNTLAINPKKKFYKTESILKESITRQNANKVNKVNKNNRTQILPPINPKKNIKKLENSINKSANEISKFNIYDNDDMRNNESRKFFVSVQGNSENHVTISNRYIPELQESFKNILNLMNSVYFKNPNILQEMLLDFIKEPNGKWLIINCKGYKIKEDSNSNKKEIKEKINIKEKLDESAYSIKPYSNICESVSEESLVSDVSSVSDDEAIQIEKAAKNITTIASEMNNKKSFSFDILTNKAYIELKEGDELGRIPHRMIGIMPHKQSNPMTYFIDKPKNLPIKPLKHKERAKNFHWFGTDKINPEVYFELATKNITKVSNIYSKHRYEGAISRLYLSTKAKVTELINQKGKEIQNGIDEFLLTLDKNFHYCEFFQNRANQDIQYIATGIFNSLNPKSELNLRELLRRSHKGLDITKADFITFSIDLVNQIKLKAQLQDNQAEVLIKRIQSLEKEIIKEWDILMTEYNLYYINVFFSDNLRIVVESFFYFLVTRN